MNGILLIDKPTGWTSFDVVAKVRGIVRQQTGIKRPKVGHAGTLDPLANGLLVILVGSYCKRAQEYSKLDKQYRVELTLGVTSATDDGEGEKLQVSDKVPSRDEIEQVISGFTGLIAQVPPIYSAIKVEGKRAYKLARAGEQPKLEPRSVTIHSIDNVDYEYPILKFDTLVSSGTYIRSLARDIGETLGTGAYMSQLRRVSIGQYDVKDAHHISQLSPETIEGYLLD